MPSLEPKPEPDQILPTAPPASPPNPVPAAAPSPPPSPPPVNPCRGGKSFPACAFSNDPHGPPSGPTRIAIEAFAILFAVLLMATVGFLFYHYINKRLNRQESRSHAQQDEESPADRPLAPILMGIFVAQPDGQVDIAITSDRSSSTTSAASSGSAASRCSALQQPAGAMSDVIQADNAQPQPAAAANSSPDQLQEQEAPGSLELASFVPGENERPPLRAARD